MLGQVDNMASRSLVRGGADVRPVVERQFAHDLKGMPHILFAHVHLPARNSIYVGSSRWKAVLVWGLARACSASQATVYSSKSTSAPAQASATIRSTNARGIRRIFCTRPRRMTTDGSRRG